MQMKLLIVSPCYGAFGGIESFVLALAKELQINHNIDITLCFKRVQGFKLSSSLNDLIIKSKFKVVFVERGSIKLFDLIRSSDLVHCQTPCIDIAVFAKILQKPLVMTIHNWCRRKLQLNPLMCHLAYHLADRHWYNSDFVWNSWEPTNKRSTSAKLPIVSNLPIGIIPTSERKGFVFVGRWIANKGLEVLLEAYAQASLNRDAWPLILMGDGPLRPKIEAKICEQQIKGVVIKGFVNDQTRNDIIRHAKWMVTPPHTNEDLGLTPIEARHVGVPCIITRDGGLTEAGGVHALSCEPGNVEQLKQLLEKAGSMNEDQYQRLSEATHQELLDYLQPMSLYIEHYQQILDSKNGSVAKTLFL